MNQSNIQYLKISNFKSIESLELRNINDFSVFAGANGSQVGWAKSFSCPPSSLKKWWATKRRCPPYISSGELGTRKSIFTLV
jgi:hypothetical protein